MCRPMPIKYTCIKVGLQTCNEPLKLEEACSSHGWWLFDCIGVEIIFSFNKTVQEGLKFS